MQSLHPGRLTKPWLLLSGGLRGRSLLAGPGRCKEEKPEESMKLKTKRKKEKKERKQEEKKTCHFAGVCQRQPTPPQSSLGQNLVEGAMRQKSQTTKGRIVLSSLCLEGAPGTPGRGGKLSGPRGTKRCVQHGVEGRKVKRQHKERKPTFRLGLGGC